MYSKAYSDRRYAVGSENENISVPPRYGGVRFVKTKRSDGRESVFERNAVPMAKINAEEIPEEIEDAPVSAEITDASEAEAPDAAVPAAETVPERKTRSPFAELLKNVGEDDILIIALILIIAAEKGEGGREIILLLALLLCFR